MKKIRNLFFYVFAIMIFPIIHLLVKFGFIEIAKEIWVEHLNLRYKNGLGRCNGNCR
jgi:hypothetical protein